MDNQSKKLFRSRTNAMFGGVCGGIGEYTHIDPTVIRLLWVLITVLTGGVPGIIAYITLLFVIPKQP